MALSNDQLVAFATKVHNLNLHPDDEAIVLIAGVSEMRVRNVSEEKLIHLVKRELQNIPHRLRQWISGLGRKIRALWPKRLMVKK